MHRLTLLTLTLTLTLILPTPASPASCPLTYSSPTQTQLLAYPPSPAPSSLIDGQFLLDDINSDSILDLLSFNKEAASISTALGNPPSAPGGPTFTPTAFDISISNLVSFSLGDINADTFPDLVVFVNGSTPLVAYIPRDPNPSPEIFVTANITVIMSGFEPTLFPRNQGRTLWTPVLTASSSRADLILSTTQGLLLFPNQAPELPFFPTGSILTSSTQTYAVVVGDADNDGLVDLVVSSTGIYVFTQLPPLPPSTDPVFSRKFIAGVLPRTMEVGFVDGNDVLDLVLGFDGGVTLLLDFGLVGSTLSTDIVTDLSTSYAVTLADVNGDSFLDVLYTAQDFGQPGSDTPAFSLAYVPNSGTGVFNAPPQILVPPPSLPILQPFLPPGFIPGSQDGAPGHTVYATNSTINRVNPPTVASFRFDEVENTVGPYTSVALADFNTDGRLDLLLVSNLPPTILITPVSSTSPATLTFQSEKPIFTTSRSELVADSPSITSPQFVDLNMDGYLDVVFYHPISGFAFVLKNLVDPGTFGGVRFLFSPRSFPERSTDFDVAFAPGADLASLVTCDGTNVSVLAGIDDQQAPYTHSALIPLPLPQTHGSPLFVRFGMVLPTHNLSIVVMTNSSIVLYPSMHWELDPLVVAQGMNASLGDVGPMAIADVNGDSVSDIIFLAPTPSSTTLGYVTYSTHFSPPFSGGALEAPVTLESFTLPASRVHVGDASGDGRVDVYLQVGDSIRIVPNPFSNASLVSQIPRTVFVLPGARLMGVGPLSSSGFTDVLIATGALFVARYEPTYAMRQVGMDLAPLNRPASSIGALFGAAALTSPCFEYQATIPPSSLPITRCSLITQIRYEREQRIVFDLDGGAVGDNERWDIDCGEDGGGILSLGPGSRVTLRRMRLWNATFSADPLDPASSIVVDGKDAVLLMDSCEVGGCSSEGAASNRLYARDGGAILVGNGGSLNVNGSVFVGNTAGGAGGAIAVMGSVGGLSVSHSVITGNTAGSVGGGAVAVVGSQCLARFADVVLDTNVAAGQGDGGAVLLGRSASDSYVEVVNRVLVEGNVAGGVGGAVAIASKSTGSSAFLGGGDVVVRGGWARKGGAFAVVGEDGEIKVEAVVRVEEVRADYGGVAYVCGGGRVEVDGVVEGVVAERGGGGVYSCVGSGGEVVGDVEGWGVDAGGWGRLRATGASGMRVVGMRLGGMRDMMCWFW